MNNFKPWVGGYAEHVQGKAWAIVSNGESVVVVLDGTLDRYRCVVSACLVRIETEVV